MKRVRVLHLRATNFVGGPERQLFLYAEHEREGPREIVLGSFVGPNEGREFLDEARSRGLQTLALPTAAVAGLRELVKFLRDQDVSIVCTHGYKADILGILAGRWCGIPVVPFLHGWTREDWKVHLYEVIDRLFLPYAARIVCLSEKQAQILRKRGLPAPQVCIIPNAIKTPDWTEQDRQEARTAIRQWLGVAANARIVASAGRLSPEKGTTHFLEAAAQIHAQLPEVVFAVFGDGPERGRLEAQAMHLGLQRNVSFEGFVPEFARMMAGLDVLVNPSLSEQMPVVVLEAMAAGVPLVATAVGGVPEIAGSQRTMLLGPPGDAEAIASMVIQLLKDPETAREMGRRARARVEEAFSPSQQRSRLQALYRDLLAPNEDLGSASMPPGLAASKPAPFLSVVIPVRNEEAHLRFVLEDLLAQDYPPDRWELLVADGNSTDGTRDVVRHYSERSQVHVECLPNPSQLSSAGRNVGARASRGQYVLFVDGHCRIPSRSLLRDTVRLFEETGADCLCRPQPLDSSENTWLQRVIADARASLIGHGHDSTVYATSGDRFVEPMSSGACYRADVFEKIGYYDERFDACEDVEFNYRLRRAGLRSFWSARLAVQYSPRTSLGGLWKQLVRYGRGRFRFARRHPEALTLAQLVPAAFVAWVIAGGVASFASPLAAKIYTGSLAVYAAIVLLSSMALGLRHGLRHLFAAPFVYLTIHGGLGTGYWAEALDTLLGRTRLPQSGVLPRVVEGQSEAPSAAANRRKYGESEVRTPSLKG